MIKRTPHIILLSFCALALLSSCRPTLLLKESEFLVEKNKIRINTQNVSKDEINSYIKQQPNRKILWMFRFHLGVYNMGSKPFPEDIEQKLKNTPVVKRFVPLIIRTDSIYKHNLRTIIGEPPVILDTVQAQNSAKQIQLFLGNKGFFNSEVVPVYNYRRKKVNVIYDIITPAPYYINNLTYNAGDDHALQAILLSVSKNSLIKQGDIYDIDKFDSERGRITKILRNDGYYLFSKDYINFKIDSTIGNRSMDVEVNVRKFTSKYQGRSDSLITSNHSRFRINKIIIYPEFSPLSSIEGYKDTTIIRSKRKKKSEGNERVYYFLHNNPLEVRPLIITQSVFISSGDYFNLDDVNRTYNRLAELRNFKRITIQFDEVSSGDELVNTSDRYLDCKIMLPPALKQAVSVEAEGTNSGGNLGLGGIVQYENRNIFGGAEIFNFRIKGQAAVQKVFGEPQGQDLSAILPFNTIEAGGDARILLPRFLMPVSPERFSKSFRPKTTINSGYNYQKRPDYTRYIANVALGYEWRESATKKWILSLLGLNMVKIYPSESFQQRIDSIQNIKIKNTYRDHLITNGRIDFVLNTQPKTKNFVYFKGGFESAGFLLRCSNVWFNGAKPGESYSILGVKYTQYVRFDLDGRYYHNLKDKSQLVSRAFIGLGLPYGNVNVLPFEKSFYAGGANSIRAWKLKTLGPGAYTDTLGTMSFERIGDISFEANLEYRFPLYSFLNAAVFIDAGNVWLKNRNKEFPDGNLEFKRALGEIAIGAGLGARFDFGFFIVRLDGGVPLKDPSLPQGERWVIKDFKTRRIIGNLGIGYPF